MLNAVIIVKSVRLTTRLLKDAASLNWSMTAS